MGCSAAAYWEVCLEVAVDLETQVVCLEECWAEGEGEVGELCWMLNVELGGECQIRYRLVIIKGK